MEGNIRLQMEYTNGALINHFRDIGSHFDSQSWSCLLLEGAKNVQDSEMWVWGKEVIQWARISLEVGDMNDLSIRFLLWDSYMGFHGTIELARHLRQDELFLCEWPLRNSFFVGL